MTDLVLTAGATDCSLILGDGDRTLELMGSSPLGIWLSEIEVPIIAHENTYAEGSDSEGKRRVRTRPQNPTGSFRVWCGGSNAATFWGYVDDLQELVESAHQRRGTLSYTPPNGTQITYNLESIRITEMPQKGYLLKKNMGELAVEFETHPYADLAQVTIFSAQTFDGPVDSYEITTIPGHVPAKGILTVGDASTQDRDEIEWGLESDDEYVSGAPLEINGVGATTLTTSPTAVCNTGAQTHIGTKRIEARVKASETGTYVRLAWKVGDGRVTYGPWREVPSEDTFHELLLDTITIEEVPEGTHEWTGYIEGYAASNGDTVEVDTIYVIPAMVWGKAREPYLAQTPTTVVAYDDLTYSTGGTLSAQTAPLGGVWDEAGDTDDFIGYFDAYVRRVSINESINQGGQFANLSTLDEDAVMVQVESTINYGAYDDDDYIRTGVFARYSGTADWLMGVRDIYPYGNQLTLAMLKCAGGTLSTLGFQNYSGISTAWRAIRLEADTAGNADFYSFVPGGDPGAARVSVRGDSQLAAGGTLASGAVGIYDACSADGGTFNRLYRNFVAYGNVEDPDHVLYSGGTAILSHEAYHRQNAALTRYGRKPIEGRYLTIPPATRANRKSRLVLKARRYDNQSGMPDDGLADDLTATLAVIPRVLLVSD